MGKERPHNLVCLRLRGPEPAVRALLDTLRPLIAQAMEKHPSKQGCRVGRAIRITGRDHASRKPHAECHINLPYETFCEALNISQEKNTVG